MAYQGYLLKVGSYTVPHSWIKAGSYSCTLHGQDLDSYRDANGELQRTALKHTVIGIQFETPPLKTMSEFESFMANIRSNYIDATEKSVNITAFVFEKGEYVTQKAYIPDIEISPYFADKNKILLNSVKLEFIGY